MVQRWHHLQPLVVVLFDQYRTITAPSLHHHCTITAPSLHHHDTITAPSLHLQPLVVVLCDALLRSSKGGCSPGVVMVR
jgi:hypothetical protein